MADEVIYTPRFMEDFVINKLKTHPELTNEQITQEFLAEHGEKFDRYLRNLDATIKSLHGKDISKLESEKEALKEELILALKAKGILGDDEKSKIVINYIKQLGIHFTWIGGGWAESGKNYVEIDWIQTYKFVTDYPYKKYSFYLLAKGTVFHELAHKISSFIGAGTWGLMIEGTRTSIEEKFAEGVSNLVITYLGLKDEYTDYYKEKEKEIIKLENLRKRMHPIIGLMRDKARSAGWDILMKRSERLVFVYGAVASVSMGIEFYANPLSAEEIKAIVHAALDKFQV